jgi:hypothetical protein
MQPIKTVIHVHTDYSPDARTPVDAIVRTAKADRIGCVAVTDHNTIRGAEALAARASFRVIIGAEISTAQGHLIGLFLDEDVPRGRPAAETADRIHDQGGLVLAPHPFARACAFSLNDTTEQIADRIDAVEVFNAQNPIPYDDRRAVEFARRHGLPAFAGSDSHLPCSIAPCYQWMDPFDGAASFLESLRGASLVAARQTPRYCVEYGFRYLKTAALGCAPRSRAADARGDHDTPRCPAFPDTPPR